VDIATVERWVRGRSEMRYVNVVDLAKYRAPRGTAHFHVYVCEPGHLATVTGWKRAAEMVAA
jgi:hypothetical protein